MFKQIKRIAVATTIMLTVGLAACEKTQDIVPVQTGAAKTAVITPGTPKTFRLTQVGKMKVSYNHDGTIDKADDSHHRIQYDYQAGNKILVSHFYENNLRWTTQIQLDANGRCVSSKSTNVTPKQYITEEQTLNYTYNGDGRLEYVKSYDRQALATNSYEFTYSPVSNPPYTGDLSALTHINKASNTMWSVGFNAGHYYLKNGGVDCPLLVNKGNVNQVIHLSQWGAEPTADIIDFFLPIYGVMPRHLINRWIYSDGNGSDENTNMVYSVDANDLIETCYTFDESTVPYTYEVVPVLTPKPH